MSSELDLTSHGTFGTCLKQLMQNRGVARDTLAREIGLSRPETISNWCRGQPPTRSAEYFPKIRKALNLDDATYARLVWLACFDQKTRDKLLKGVRNADTAIRELPMKETQPQKRALAFTEQYPNLAPYWRHMETLLREHLSGFVEREEVVAGFKAFIDQHASGYFLLEAEAGLGKTALAAMFVKRFGAITHFFSAPQGITHMGKGLNFLNAQLCFTYDLALPLLPDTAGEANQVFAELLDRISGRITKVFFVIDALDEAEGRIYLPPDLPKGVYGILTFRPGLLLPGIVAPSTTWKLEANNAEQRASLTEYILQAEQLAAIRHDTVDGDYPENLGVWGQQVLSASAGNFMYARFILDDIQAGLWDLEAVTQGRLPQGLQNYYESIWTTLIHDTRVELTFGQKLLGLLALAGEPVSVAWLQTHTGSDAFTTNLVLRHWRSALHHDAENESWAMTHASWSDFLATKLDLSTLRQQLINYYLEQPQRWYEHGGYALRHLMRHLHTNGQSETLERLLIDPQWYVAQSRQDLTLSLYRMMVHILREETRAYGWDGLPSWLAWSLLLQGVQERGVNLPLEGWQALLTLGATDLAWRYLQLLPTAEEQLDRVQELIWFAPQPEPPYTIPHPWLEQLDSTLQDASSINATTMTAAAKLAQIWIILEEPQRAQTWLEKVSQQLPSLPTRERWRVQGQLALAYAQSGNREHATKLLKEMSSPDQVHGPFLYKVEIFSLWYHTWWTLNELSLAEAWFLEALQLLQSAQAAPENDAAEAAVDAGSHLDEARASTNSPVVPDENSLLQGFAIVTRAARNAWLQQKLQSTIDEAHASEVSASIHMIGIPQSLGRQHHDFLGNCIMQLEETAETMVSISQDPAAYRLLISFLLEIGFVHEARSWLEQVWPQNARDHYPEFVELQIEVFQIAENVEDYYSASDMERLERPNPSNPKDSISVTTNFMRRLEQFKLSSWQDWDTIAEQSAYQAQAWARLAYVWARMQQPQQARQALARTMRYTTHLLDSTAVQWLHEDLSHNDANISSSPNLICNLVVQHLLAGHAEAASKMLLSTEPQTWLEALTECVQVLKNTTCDTSTGTEFVRLCCNTTSQWGTPWLLKTMAALQPILSTQGIIDQTRKKMLPVLKLLGQPTSDW